RHDPFARLAFATSLHLARLGPRRKVAALPSPAVRRGLLPALVASQAKARHTSERSPDERFSRVPATSPSLAAPAEHQAASLPAQPGPAARRVLHLPRHRGAGLGGDRTAEGPQAGQLYRAPHRARAGE